MYSIFRERAKVFGSVPHEKENRTFLKRRGGGHGAIASGGGWLALEGD
jgi:hypothetical protein